MYCSTVKCLAFCVEPSLAKFVCSSNVDVDAYAAVTSESKSVGHAVHAASGFTELNDPLQSKSTADENNTYTKGKSVEHISSAVQ